MGTGTHFRGEMFQADVNISLGDIAAEQMKMKTLPLKKMG